LRAACKSVGAFGNSSTGGRGAPIDAHPVMHPVAATTSNNCSRSLFMRRMKDYINRQCSCGDEDCRVDLLVWRQPPSAVWSSEARLPLFNAQSFSDQAHRYRLHRRGRAALQRRVTGQNKKGFSPRAGSPTPPTPSPPPETPSYAGPHPRSPSSETSAPCYEMASAISLDSSHTNA